MVRIVETAPLDAAWYLKRSGVIVALLGITVFLGRNVLHGFTFVFALPIAAAAAVLYIRMLLGTLVGLFRRETQRRPAILIAVVVLIALPPLTFGLSYLIYL